MLIEYNEYIDTLQIFVDGQYSQIDLVNLVVTKDKMELLDAFQKEINNSEVKALLDEVFDEDISEGDLILSSLLALAPKKIIIHGDELDDSEIILVIKEIFLDRVKTCSGCNLCRLNSIGVKKTES
jgi:putative sporulation protein YtxC